MKGYICLKDFWIGDTLFAKKDDYLTIQSDNLTVTNDMTHKSVVNPYILDDIEYFAELSWENPDISQIADNVNSPKHYTQHPSGIECIDIARHYCFSIGNAIKYLWRAGLKKDASLSDKEKEIEDLLKAKWYIEDRIKQLKNDNTDL